MKVLIIGNGFDIEHGLATTYKEFLLSTARYDIDHKYLDYQKYQELKTFLNNDTVHEQMILLLNDNPWMLYFIQQYKDKKFTGEDWIDFENEIYKVILDYEKLVFNSEDEIISISLLDYNYKMYNCFSAKFKDGENIKLQERYKKSNEKFMAYSEFLYEELRKFIIGLEKYLCCYIENKIEELKNENCKNNRLVGVKRAYEISILHPQHVNVSDSLKQEVSNIGIYERTLKLFNFDCVLSFNYTDTYEKLYGKIYTEPSKVHRSPYKDLGNYCYIHGKACENLKGNNMILGIDDTLDKLKQDYRYYDERKYTFVHFKKYFQRIMLQTGSGYRDWIDHMNDKRYVNNNEVHIVGHSMGHTDHDILREFFDLTDYSVPKAKVFVYYHDEKSRIELIEQTINIIGKPALTQRVHGSRATIEFVDQYDEEKGLFKRHKTVKGDERDCGSSPQ